MAYHGLKVLLVIFLVSYVKTTPISSPTKSSYANNRNFGHDNVDTLVEQLFTKFSKYSTTTESNINYESKEDNKVGYTFCRNGTDCFIFPIKNIHKSFNDRELNADHEYNAENLENILRRVFQSLSENSRSTGIQNENTARLEPHQYTICRNNADCYVLTPVRKLKTDQLRYTKALETIIYDLLENIKGERSDKRPHNDLPERREYDFVTDMEDSLDQPSYENLSKNLPNRNEFHRIKTQLKNENRTNPTSRIENYATTKKDTYNERTSYNTRNINVKRNSETVDELLGKVFQTTTNKIETTTAIFVTERNDHKCSYNGKCVPLFLCKNRNVRVDLNKLNCGHLEICCELSNLVDLQGERD